MNKFGIVLSVAALSFVVTACSVGTSAKNPLPQGGDQESEKTGGGGGGAQIGTRASGSSTLSSLEKSGALLARAQLSGEMFLSSGSNIGRRRAEEIDVGIHGGSYCMFNPGKTASGSLMKITSVKEGNIYTPARTQYGVRIKFDDGGTLDLIRATYSSTVSDIERTCLGSYAEFRSL